MEQFFVFLQKNPFNMLLFGVALISGAMLIAPFLRRGAGRSAEVGPTEAVTLINRKDALVVDVRADKEFAAGHITNARNVPEEKLVEQLKTLDKFKSKPIIVSCGSGRRAAAVAEKLRKQGYAEVFSLRGGIGAWTQAGMPLEK